MHPKKNDFLEGFFVVRHTESYHTCEKHLSRKHIIYLYIYMEIFCFYYFSFSFFSPSVCKKRMPNDLFERGATVSRKKALFLSTMPVLPPFLLKNRTGTRFYWDFANVFMIFCCESVWITTIGPLEKKALSLDPRRCFQRSCAPWCIYINVER